MPSTPCGDCEDQMWKRIQNSWHNVPDITINCCVTYYDHKGEIIQFRHGSNRYKNRALWNHCMKLGEHLLSQGSLKYFVNCLELPKYKVFISWSSSCSWPRVASLSCFPLFKAALQFHFHLVLFLVKCQSVPRSNLMINSGSGYPPTLYLFFSLQNEYKFIVCIG